MVFVRLFGGARLESDLRPLKGPPAQRRRLALLALLAAHPRGLSRDRIITFLWPDRDDEHARNLLSQSVYVLRRSLGQDAIHATGDELRLDPDAVQCDTLLFERALAAGDTARAAEIYAGPFLDGFFVSGSPDFEQWADAERERYRRAYGTALEGLAREAAAAGAFARAADWWRRLAAQDPGNSRVTLRLMEALEAAGDRAGAIRQARVHAVVLEREFEAEADPAIVALAERLRTEPRVIPAGTFDEQAPEGQPTAGNATTPAETPAAVRSIPAGDLAPVHPASSAHRDRRVLTGGLVVLSAAAAFAIAAATLAEDGPRSSYDATADPAVRVAAAEAKTIAVLPFANLSGDPDEEYFSDGLTEELIGVLSRVRGLRVVGRTSAFAFKGERRDPREIGRALDVRFILEGSVRRERDRIRVRALLINAQDGLDVWSEMYDREATDAFAIWTDLAQRIADALEAELTPAERARLVRRSTPAPAAHALYLKGRYFWNQRTRSAYERAIHYFERAIATDPTYAEAHAGLAITYQLQSIYTHLSPRVAGERARVAALRALELDAELPEAHTALGGYLNAWAWNPALAERALLRAVELDPNYPFARHVYAIVLSSTGRLEEALVQRRRAAELDPLDAHLNVVLGEALLHAGRTDEAHHYMRNAIELDSTYWQAHRALGEFHSAAGRPDDARRHHRRAVALAGGIPSAMAGLARALVRDGNEEGARRILSQLEEDARRMGVHPPVVAAVRADLNDMDGAVEWLERAYRERHPALALMSADGRLAEDPRYLDLRRRVGRSP